MPIRKKTYSRRTTAGKGAVRKVYGRYVRRRPLVRRQKASFNKALLPRIRSCCLKWDSYVYATAVGFQRHQYNLNSLYDPDRTGVGTMALGHNQMSALYNNYVVHACKIRLDFINLINDQLVRICFSARDTNEAATYMDDALGETAAKSIVLAPAGSTGSKGVIKYFAKVKTIAAIKDLLDNSSYRAVVAGSPSEICWGNLYLDNDMPATAKDVFIKVRFLFYVTYVNPVNLAY